MAFLRSIFLNIDLRCNLNFLVIAGVGLMEVAELLPKLGKIALLFFLLDLLGLLRQTTLILLLGNLVLLLSLNLINDLVYGAIVKFRFVSFSFIVDLLLNSLFSFLCLLYLLSLVNLLRLIRSDGDELRGERRGAFE